MLEERLASIENLYAQKMKDYRDYNQAESNFNAKASVRIQQVKEILMVIPDNILKRLDLIPTKNIEDMDYEESKMYCNKVEKAFTEVADKIESYLNTGDINQLNGIEEAVGIVVQDATSNTNSSEPDNVTQLNDFVEKPNQLIEIEDSILMAGDSNAVK